MSKWYLALVSVGLLFIVFSETSQNQGIMILVGSLICGFGTAALISNKKGVGKK
ncbi:MAG: hypothetical protein R3Y09_10285 [Clostridia bacterium]